MTAVRVSDVAKGFFPPSFSFLISFFLHLALIKFKTLNELNYLGILLCQNQLMNGKKNISIKKNAPEHIHQV